MSHVIVSSVARAAAVLTLAALAFGLPQFLVLCTPDRGAPHVELLCSAGCRHHAPATDAADERDEGPGDGSPGARDDRGGRAHDALGVELGPPPVKVSFEIDDEMTGDAPAAEQQPRLDVAATRWLPATGPPRPPRTISVLRTTELRE